MPSLLELFRFKGHSDRKRADHCVYQMPLELSHTDKCASVPAAEVCVHQAPVLLHNALTALLEQQQQQTPCNMLLSVSMPGEQTAQT